MFFAFNFSHGLSHLRIPFSLLKMFKAVMGIYFSVGSSVDPTDYCIGYILHSLTCLDVEVSRFLVWSVHVRFSELKIFSGQIIDQVRVAM